MKQGDNTKANGTGLWAARSASATLVPSRLHLNEAPEGISEKLLAAAVEEIRIANRYPDAGAQVARAALAGHLSLDPLWLILGNGCDELILWIVLNLARDGEVLTTSQTYPGYRAAAQLARVDFREVPLTNWGVSVDAVLNEITARTRVAIICNPHNPCGTHLRHSDVRRFVNACETKGIIPVVDEAYIDFAPKESESCIDLVKQGATLVVLRTFSKAYGLAGIRAGFAVAPAHIIAELQLGADALPFSVNRIAQRFITEFCAQPSLFGQHISDTVRLRDLFEAMLKRRNIWHVPSNGNFVFTAAPEGFCIDAAKRAGVEIRDCGPMGCPGYLRISIGSPSDMARVSRLLNRHLN
jgi:histidinol-phosphate aminotransferase